MHVPPVRSSDDDVSLRDPFLYFLTRRLGLTHCLSDSDALVVGSWAHHALEFDELSGADYTSGDREAFAFTLDRRCEEIEKQAYTRLGYSYDTVESLKSQERQRAYKALAIWEAARSARLGPQYGTLQKWLSQSHIHVIARELPLRAVLWGYECVSILDMLIYNSRTGYLWPLDLKSTAMKAQDRCASFLLEMQTLLYPRMVQENLDGVISTLLGDIIDKQKPRVGGMIHLVTEKPQIKFCDKDRNFTEKPHELKSGPRKGQIEIRREYYGEPVYTNYLSRVRSWFEGTGEYEPQRALIEASPRVEISVVPMDDIVSNEPRLKEKVLRIGDLATREPNPLLFPYNSQSIFTKSGLSHYAPFYLNPPSTWPILMDQHGFLIKHREGPDPDGQEEADE